MRRQTETKSRRIPEPGQAQTHTLGMVAAPADMHTYGDDLYGAGLLLHGCAAVATDALCYTCLLCCHSRCILTHGWCLCLDIRMVLPHTCSGPIYTKRLERGYGSCLHSLRYLSFHLKHSDSELGEGQWGVLPTGSTLGHQLNHSVLLTIMHHTWQLCQARHVLLRARALSQKRHAKSATNHSSSRNEFLPTWHTTAGVVFNSSIVYAAKTNQDTFSTGKRTESHNSSHLNRHQDLFPSMHAIVHIRQFL